MTVVMHPTPGTIVRVDFKGFRVPEMVKRRPAVVLSPPISGRKQVCCVVPLSTTKPSVIGAHHMQISFYPPLPDPYSVPTVWVKGDMVYTVAFSRLRLLFSGWAEGQRVYDVRVIDAETLASVKNCVRAGLGL